MNKIMRETGRQPLMSDGEEGSSPLHEGNTSPRVNEDLLVTSRSSPMRIEVNIFIKIIHIKCKILTDNIQKRKRFGKFIFGQNIAKIT